MEPLYQHRNTSNRIIDAILNQIQEGNDYPYLYSVIQFGFFNNDGNRLTPIEIRKYWDKSEVDKTCKLLYNMLKETFNMDRIWMFVERHQSVIDDEGIEIKKGRFHINIIASSIKDGEIEEPNRKVRRLMLENGRFDIPIEQNVYRDLDEIKTELFNACCRRANWCNKYKHSIKTQMLYEPSDIENVVHYCLKDYYRNNVDFTDTIVWKASDFYKP